MNRLSRGWHGISLVYLSDRFLTAVVSLGLLIRLRDYLHNRSLWLDEAKISMNVLTRSFTQLLEPLDLEQGSDRLTTVQKVLRSNRGGRAKDLRPQVPVRFDLQVPSKISRVPANNHFSFDLRQI